MTIITALMRCAGCVVAVPWAAATCQAALFWTPLLAAQSASLLWQRCSPLGGRTQITNRHCCHFCCRSFSYYKLKLQEEELLAAVLSRDDSALEADDPFDPLLLNLDDLQDDSTYAAATDQQDNQLGCRPSASHKPSGSSTGPTAAAEGDSVSADAGVLTSMRTASYGSVGAEGFFTPRGFSEGVSRLGSCLSGSVFSLMRPSSGRRGRRCSLAEIDAQLEAMQAERDLAQQLKEGQAGETWTAARACQS